MSGRFWKFFHLVGVFAMLALWLVAGLLGWLQSVTFVSHVSMAALVLAELSSWQGSRTEQKQDQQMEETEEDVEEVDEDLDEHRKKTEN